MNIKLFRFLIFLYSFLILPTLLYPRQELIPGIKFRNITTKDGLSSNSVQACLLDSYGFLWIGTQLGLSSYDDTGIRIDEHVNSAPENGTEIIIKI